MKLDDATAAAFLANEARLLDEERYSEWLDLFTEQAWYWVPTQAGQASPRNTVSLMYDDRRLMEARVRRLGNTAIHAQTPRSRTSRMVTNVTVEPSDNADEAKVRAKLMMVEYRRNQQRLFAATCWYGLRSDAGKLRIAWKRVDLVNCDAEHDGIVIPF
jgi:benzoate/toluate 1,2-dioxygenase beta subunit